MKTILISIFLVCLCFLAICIKIILIKNGKFSGTCASNNPFLNKKYLKILKSRNENWPSSVFLDKNIRQFPEVVVKVQLGPCFK